MVTRDGLTHGVQFRVRAFGLDPDDNVIYSDWVESPMVAVVRETERVTIDPPTGFTVELLRDGNEVLPDQIACSWTCSDNVFIYAGYGPPSNEKWSKRLTTVNPADNFAILEDMRKILPRDGQQHEVSFKMFAIRGGVTSGTIFATSTLMVTSRQPEAAKPPSVQAYDRVVDDIQVNKKISFAAFALLVTGDLDKSQIAESIFQTADFDGFRTHTRIVDGSEKKTFTTKETILLVGAKNMTTDQDALLSAQLAFARERILSDDAKKAEFVAWAESNLEQDARDVFETINTPEDYTAFLAYASQNGLL